MITLTVAQLVDAVPALERLAAERLPVATASRIATVLRVVRPEHQRFIAQRNAWIREHGAERTLEDGARVIEVIAAQHGAFTAKITDLAAREVPLPIAPLTLAALEGAHVSAADLVALDPLLEELEEPCRDLPPSRTGTRASAAAGTTRAVGPPRSATVE